MASLTLSIPEELRDEMKKFPEINWSEVARQAIMYSLTLTPSSRCETREDRIASPLWSKASRRGSAIFQGTLRQFSLLSGVKLREYAIIQKAGLLERMDRILAQEGLTEKEAREVTKEVKERVWKKHVR